MGFAKVIITGVQVLVTLLSGWLVAHFKVLDADVFSRKLNEFTLKILAPCFSMWLIGVKTDMRDGEAWRLIWVYIVWNTVLQVLAGTYVMLFCRVRRAREFGLHSLVVTYNNTGIIGMVMAEAVLGPSMASLGLIISIPMFLQQVVASMFCFELDKHKQAALQQREQLEAAALAPDVLPVHTVYANGNMCAKGETYAKGDMHAKGEIHAKGETHVKHKMHAKRGMPANSAVQVKGERHAALDVGVREGGSAGQCQAGGLLDQQGNKQVQRFSAVGGLAGVTEGELVSFPAAVGIGGVQDGSGKGTGAGLSKGDADYSPPYHEAVDDEGSKGKNKMDGRPPQAAEEKKAVGLPGDAHSSDCTLVVVVRDREANAVTARGATAGMRKLDADVSPQGRDTSCYTNNVFVHKELDAVVHEEGSPLPFGSLSPMILDTVGEHGSGARQCSMKGFWTPSFNRIRSFRPARGANISSPASPTCPAPILLSQLRHICLVVLTNPLLAFTMLSVILSLAGLPNYLDPERPGYILELGWIDASLAWFAKATSPLAIFAQGLWLHGKIRQVVSQPVKACTYMAVKLFAGPALMLLLTMYCGLEDRFSVGLVIMTCLPVGQIAWVLCEQYKMGADAVTAVMLLGTITMLPHVLLMLQIIDNLQLFKYK